MGHQRLQVRVSRPARRSPGPPEGICRTGAPSLWSRTTAIGRRDSGPAKGTGLGTRLVNGVAATMGAEIQYLAREPGTAARLAFPLPAG